MNLGGVTYYSNALPFVDLMKNAEPFRSQNVAPGGPWDTGVAWKIPRDADGYALELPYTVSGVSAPQALRVATGRMLYAGDYVLLYDGDGDFEFLASNSQVVSRAAGRIVLRVSTPSANTIFITVTRSNKANHVRNMRLIVPGFESTYATAPFHPTYLANLRGAGTLRFMDWGCTNGSYSKVWADRTDPGAFQGNTNGVSIETMIDMANQVGADAWFNVPHLADDNYVTQMATLIKSRLGSSQRVYIEYSNELWNAIFSQMHWSATQGCSVGLDKVGPYAGDCATNSGAMFWAGEKWNARRSAQIFQIFAQVFGGTQRLVRVIAGQAANASLNDTILQAFADPQVNPLVGQAGVGVDALAIAPYFGGGIGDSLAANGQVATITIDGIISMAQNLMATEVTQRVTNNKNVADKHGVRLIAYEGGQHLVGNGAAQSDATLTQKLIAANRDPRMYGLYQSMFDAWYQASGGGMFVAFSYIDEPSKFGSWGVLETQTQTVTTAPKYMAFRDRLSALGVP